MLGLTCRRVSKCVRADMQEGLKCVRADMQEGLEVC